MSLRPWMTRRFLVALLAMGLLFILLVAACLRLLSSENQNRDYITEDLVWLTSQGQYEAVRFGDALSRYGQNDIGLDEVQLSLDLTASRIVVLEDGEPYRQLEELGLADRLQGFRAVVEDATVRLAALQPEDRAEISALHQEALTLASELRDLANAALFAKRERDAMARAERRHTLYEVLGTLMGTMVAGLILVAVLVRDHRNMVSAEAALERERQVSRLHRAFISIVSHQFRTPLAIIDASAQRMIRRGLQMSGDEITSRAEKIRVACQRLTRLMESTLNAARLDEGEVTLNLRVCSLPDLLQNVVENQPENDQRRIEIVTEDLPGLILADTVLLEQAVQNLVSNGVKYSAEGQPVTVRARGTGDTIEISVTDQGVGVPADEVDSLFRRFFRARTAESIPGTGIGLSFVAQIMELHGGRVSVESVEGLGSTFTLSFPARLPHSSDKPTTHSHPEVTAQP